MADQMENIIVGERRQTDANYVAVMGKLALQQKSIEDVQKRVEETRQDFKDAIKEHRESNKEVVEAIKGEVAALSKGFDEMTSNVKRIQYILLGGALFYILDSIGLKAFLIKIMGA
jgi:hypothetical protein